MSGSLPPGGGGLGGTRPLSPPTQPSPARGEGAKKPKQRTALSLGTNKEAADVRTVYGDSGGDDASGHQPARNNLRRHPSLVHRSGRGHWGSPRGGPGRRRTARARDGRHPSGRVPEVGAGRRRG